MLKILIIVGLSLALLFLLSNYIEPADERVWVKAGQKFGQAIVDFRPADTYIQAVSHRLGVSVLWVSAVIYWVSGLSFQPQLIMIHRFVFLTINITLFGLAIFLLRRYVGSKTLILFILYMIFNRYFIFLGRSSWLDQFLVLFGFLTTLFWINYLEKRQKGNLIVAGIFNGLNLLTKYAGWYFFPVIVALTIYFSIRRQQKLNNFFLPFATMLEISLFILIVFYPEMWVNPQKALLLRFQDQGLKVEQLSDIWSYLNQIRYLDPVLVIGSAFVWQDFLKKRLDPLHLLGISGLFYLSGFFLTFAVLIVIGRLNFSFLEGFYRYTFPAILPLSVYTFARLNVNIKNTTLKTLFIVALFLKEIILQ